MIILVSRSRAPPSSFFMLGFFFFILNNLACFQPPSRFSPDMPDGTLRHGPQLEHAILEVLYLCYGCQMSKAFRLFKYDHVTTSACQSEWTRRRRQERKNEEKAAEENRKVREWQHAWRLID